VAVRIAVVITKLPSASVYGLPPEMKLVAVSPLVIDEALSGAADPVVV
jgi:hypothetical protein